MDINIEVLNDEVKKIYAKLLNIKDKVEIIKSNTKLDSKQVEKTEEKK